MDKILLIEDRFERQKRFMDETKIDLYSSEITSILDNIVGESYIKIFNDLKNDTYNFDKYAIIILHKSAFDTYNTSIIAKLERYCHESSKVLVLFSGGIDANYYLKDENFELIELNSKTFYSHNLQIFLEDFKNNNLHPLILCYGDKWKLNILLNILETLNLYIDTTNKDKILYKTFMRDNPDIPLLNTLNVPLQAPTSDSAKICIKEIINFRDNILEYINKSLLNE